MLTEKEEKNTGWPIGITGCDSYDAENVMAALKKVLEEIDGLDFVTPGMTIAIKTNLVTPAAPKKAVVTHPAVLTALTRLLTGRGAKVVIGDSPGGLFTVKALEANYKISGLEEVVRAGAVLNTDVSTQEVHFPEAKVLKNFTCTSWLLKADAVIDCCKLKTHGMMGLSANVKNMFGVIPGTMKPEYHFRFPDHGEFADMLVDINAYIKPKLYITDAVVGMEGNGPTSGTPRKIGALLASKDPYGLDLVCAGLIGLSAESVPTIKAAISRGLCPADQKELSVLGNPADFVVRDYQLVTKLWDIEFSSNVPGFLMPVARKILKSRPAVAKKECIGCAKCAAVCPAKAIRMKNKRPVIDESKCIRCFCCQEFCPKGAMKVLRNPLMRLLSGS